MVVVVVFIFLVIAAVIVLWTLKGPLKEWAKDLINSEDGYINQNYLQNIWIEHIEEKKDNSTILWRVLMWRFWLFSNV